MPAIFRTDSGIFGDIQATNMFVTGEIKVGESQQPINQYITQEINTVVGEGIDYSAEITTLSGNINTVSGDLSALSGVVDGLNVGGAEDITNISGSLNTVSGRVDTISGDLVTTNNTLNVATGNIDTISGAVEGILNAEAADDTAFNTVSGRVDTISGDLVTTNNTLNVATGNIDTISGEVENILVARVAEDEEFNLLSETVSAATGNIDTISGAVEGILNAEIADDTAFNNLSGSVNTVSGDLDTLESTVDIATGNIFTISGDLNTLSSTVDTATGNINEISGVVQTLSANSTTYGDTDVATYLDGNLNADIIPATNSTYDIGSAEKKIRHLYLSNNSLYMGGEGTNPGTQISSTPEGAIVFPSGVNISGAIGGVTPNAENDSIQWNDSEKKWVAGDKLSTTVNTLNTTTGDLYGFYKKENNIINNVSGSFTTLSFGTHTIPQSGSAAGQAGQIAYDSNYIYLCVAQDTWRRLLSVDFD